VFGFFQVCDVTPVNWIKIQANFTLERKYAKSVAVKRTNMSNAILAGGDGVSLKNSTIVW
jgi:hypothetical protein